MFEFITEEKTLLQKLQSGLKKTKQSVGLQFDAMLKMGRHIDEGILTPLEEALIQSDIGVVLATDLIEKVQNGIRSHQLTDGQAVKKLIREELMHVFRSTDPWWEKRYPQPAVFMIIGVNGTGKTTTIAKLAQEYKTQKKKVLICAADTFRAAAVDQLQVWGDRLKIEVIAGAPESDPGAVAFSAVGAGVARGVDIIMIDTAGRLHTRSNLMEELKKVQRVLAKALPGAPHAVWLVLDATTGQNALQQARAYKDAVGVTGVLLAKLDSSARGGMAFAIQRELNLPILFAGLGEKVDDLQPFDPDAFVDGILSSS